MYILAMMSCVFTDEECIYHLSILDCYHLYSVQRTELSTCLFLCTLATHVSQKYKSYSLDSSTPVYTIVRMLRLA